MTGHQDNPFTGRTLAGEPAPQIEIEAVVRALGVTDVRVVDPNLLRPTEKALREATAADGLSVIIAKAPCVLLTRERNDPYRVDAAKCTACGLCTNLGCPAISRDDASRATIDAEQCIGCRQCVQVCRYGAIKHVGPSCEVSGS
jgi:indolepyruvate ferredoxin oxidoreductase alpha subunit